jgi:NADPH2:quinone reductase
VRAARCETYGPPERVVVEDVPDLRPRDGGVVVEVHAASVNYPDVLIVADEYQVSIPTPFTPGSEFAGAVVAVADDVDDVREGDRVCGSTFIGAFAEQIALPAAALTAVPPSVTYAEAASFGVVYSTAYHALRSVAEVQPGEWVAVLGAAGGVGLAAVDLAKHLGARVLAAASNEGKLAVCHERGAEALVNYERDDLKVAIKELTGGGADVVIDPVGGPYAEPALRATRWGGRFVVVGFASGEIPRIPLNLVLLKGVVIKGFEFRTFAEHAPEASRRDRAELLALFADGKVRPYVSSVYPLDGVADALREVAERRALGKVVIEPVP